MATTATKTTVTAESIVDIAARIGAEVAGPAASEVDVEARFPHESVDAFRESGLLSAAIPRELGGAGVRPSEMAAAVRAIARHCCSSALVLAMHSTEVSNMARHGNTEALRELQREIAVERLLVANANSEVGTGGDNSRSVCSLEYEDGRVTLRKEALAISYGEYADLITATTRRAPSSEPSDQVQVILRRPQLEPRSDWDAMGLRGTCSRAFLLTAEVDEELIYPVPFSVIGSAGGLQGQLLFLSAVWVGLAEASADKAHRYVRAAAKRNPEVTPPSALRLAELSAVLEQDRALLRDVSDARSMRRTPTASRTRRCWPRCARSRSRPHAWASRSRVERSRSAGSPATSAAPNSASTGSCAMRTAAW